MHIRVPKKYINYEIEKKQPSISTRRHVDKSSHEKQTCQTIYEEVDLSSGTNILHLHPHDDLIFLSSYFEGRVQRKVSGSGI